MLTASGARATARDTTVHISYVERPNPFQVAAVLPAKSRHMRPRGRIGYPRAVLEKHDCGARIARLPPPRRRAPTADPRSFTTMSDERPSDVLGSLPRTRPHRRSQKRADRPAVSASESNMTDAGATKTVATDTVATDTVATNAVATNAAATRPRAAKPVPRKARATPVRPAPKPKPERLRQPAQPQGTPPSPGSRRPVPASSAEIIGTAVQAAAELAEIGLSISARAIRSAVSRLPRP